MLKMHKGGYYRCTMKKYQTEYLFLIPFILFLGIFEIYPLIVMFSRSFVSETGKLTLGYYLNIFHEPQYYHAIVNSLGFATACSLVGGVGGTLIGYYASRLPAKQRSLLLSVYSLPMTLSGLVVAFSFIVLLGRNGVINLIVQKLFHLPKSTYFDIYSWYGLVVVYAFYQIPLMTMTMAAVFRNLDYRLVEAARNLGAKQIQVWKYVIIPALAPGFVTGISIQLAGMMGAFGTVLALVGGAKNLLAIQVYYHTSESTFNLPQAAALSFVLISITSTALYFLNRIEKKLRPGG